MSARQYHRRATFDDASAILSQIPADDCEFLLQVIGTDAAYQKRKAKTSSKKEAKRGHAEVYPPLIPISRASWFAGVRSGRFPAPIRLAPNTVVWRSTDIRELIDRLDAQLAQAGDRTAVLTGTLK